MTETSSRIPLTDRQRFDWLRLIRSENVGPRTFRALLNQFGGAAAALDALPELARRSGRSLRLCSEAEAAREMERMEKIGARFIAYGEPEYPLALQATNLAPPLLAMKGNAEALSKPMMAIVGARNASALGLRLAKTLAGELGEAGLVIASGLARGVDAAAHEGSLKTGTVAVLAGGLARLYPPEHAALAERIMEQGCLLSEMPVTWTATGRDFPRRNRIVSGLSYGVLVIEAALKSGSLITARLANEQGREVFAIPGSPLDPRAEGANKLIRQGATLVASAEDILEALRPLIESGEPPPSPMREGESDLFFDEWQEFSQFETLAENVQGNLELTYREKIIGLLSPSPVAMDDLVRASGLDLREVQLAVLELDLAGRIERHGNSRISLL